MFFLILLITFSVTELLLYHLGVVAIMVPVAFIAIGVLYLYYKNTLLAQADMVAYEKRIKKLELTQRLLIILLLIVSLAVMANFITRMFLP